MAITEYYPGHIYCNKCGTLLKIYASETFISTLTGERNDLVFRKCPNYRWWNRHMKQPYWNEWDLK